MQQDVMVPHDALQWPMVLLSLNSMVKGLLLTY